MHFSLQSTGHSGPQWAQHLPGVTCVGGQLWGNEGVGSPQPGACTWAPQACGFSQEEVAPNILDAGPSDRRSHMMGPKCQGKGPRQPRCARGVLCLPPPSVMSRDAAHTPGRALSPQLPHSHLTYTSHSLSRTLKTILTADRGFPLVTRHPLSLYQGHFICPPST